MKSAGKILVVDDNRETLNLLLQILTAEDYEVYPADSGELALASLAVSPPELILLDVRMTGMGGLEVCRTLKLDPGSRDIPVLFLSASLDFEVRLRGLQSGAVDFIGKPFHREELLVRVKTHLELARLRKDLERRVAERTAELRSVNEDLKRELEARRRTEEELRESERRFRSIADTAPAGIFLSGADGPPFYANKWLLTFLGATKEQIEGEGWLAFVHPADRQHSVEQIAASVSEQRHCQLENRLLRSDGEYRWVTWTANPRFMKGAFAGHIGVGLDTTELKLAQERELASQKLESIGMLAAGIAHNFNNLLSTILAHSELAMQDIPGDTPAYESISTIAQVALRAADIVALLVAYSDHRESCDAPEPVELSSLVRRMVPLLRSAIAGTTLLDLRLSEHLPPVTGDAGQMQQVVLNLVLNASEALEGRPGTVSVLTGKRRAGRELPELSPSGLAEGDYVVLTISDAGPGMTREIKERIFDPFFSTRFPGRGLGLPAVQGIVRVAGGVIDVGSSPGHGTTVDVWLPCGEIGEFINERLGSEHPELSPRDRGAAS